MIPAPGTRGPVNAGLEIRSARPVSGAAGTGSFNPPAAAELTAGRLVRATVLKFLGGNSWSVSVDGTAMPARSSLALVPGQVLFTRVEVGIDSVFLRLVPQSSVMDFLQSNNLPTDAAMRAAVEALMRSGLSLEPSILRRFRAILLRAGDRHTLNERARWLAISEKKGLAIDSDGLDALTSFSRHGGHHGQGDRGDRRDRQPDDGPEALRRAVNRVDETPNHPVQLFNQARGSEREHWVVVSIGYRAADTDYDASLRLLLSIDSRTVLRGSLVAEAESGSWGFEWQMADEKVSRLTIHAPVPNLEQTDEFRRLRTLLRGLGVDTVDTEESGQPFDGFSSELPMDIMHSVQEDV